MSTNEVRIFRDGSAPSPAINRERRRDRATDELIGLCKGMLADGHLQEVEARFLVDWLHAHSEFAAEYRIRRHSDGYRVLVRKESSGL